MHTYWVIENNAGPITWGELCFADVSDLTGFSATHPYSFADYKTVSVLSQHHAVICNSSIAND